jgi:hypothetical protein
MEINNLSNNTNYFPFNNNIFIINKNLICKFDEVLFKLLL